MFDFLKKKTDLEKSNESLIEVACLLIHASKIDENYTEEEKDIIKKQKTDEKSMKSYDRNIINYYANKFIGIKGDMITNLMAAFHWLSLYTMIYVTTKKLGKVSDFEFCKKSELLSVGPAKIYLPSLVGTKTEPPGKMILSPLVRKCTQSCPKSMSTSKDPLLPASGSANVKPCSDINFCSHSESAKEFKLPTILSLIRTLDENLSLESLLPKNSTLETSNLSFLAV